MFFRLAIQDQPQQATESNTGNGEQHREEPEGGHQRVILAGALDPDHHQSNQDSQQRSADEKWGDLGCPTKHDGFLLGLWGSVGLVRIRRGLWRNW
ncbi:hypothetical protein DYI20_04295 [Auritidibacter ignavus]|nr:hypothetical protein DCC25_04185 [Auritidibacter sp. NML120636]RMX23525.1 hypothetical protein DYI20_04295 [Auritidibacter ignavus]